MDFNQEKWDSFVLTHSGSFLQSFEWGEFQEKFGRKACRLADEGWQAQFVEMPLPLGKKYWYGSKAPLLANSQQLTADYQLEEFIEKIKGVAKKEGVMFFRIGPEWLADMELEAKLEILGFKKLRYDIEPSQTLILDISKSEQELLAQMHSKWRYNIGLAQKKEVEIEILNGDDSDFEEYFERFYKLLEMTTQRQGIKHHPKDYYKKQLQTKGDNLKMLLFAAEHRGLTIAANIVAVFGRRATYLHGGSDNEQRSLMAPHLLQWEQIREAKKQGCSEYDFWGIDEQKWPGITRFKRGFGGHEESFIGHWDYPMDKKWYLLYKGVQKFRR